MAGARCVADKGGRTSMGAVGVTVTVAVAIVEVGGSLNTADRRESRQGKEYLLLLRTQEWRAATPEHPTHLQQARQRKMRSLDLQPKKKQGSQLGADSLEQRYFPNQHLRYPVGSAA